MKKTRSILFCAACLSLLFMACNNQNDSVDRAQKSNENKDDRNINAMDSRDAEFAVKAADGGMLEVEMGKIAKEKGSLQDVKDFGDMMVSDHSAANEKLKAIAAGKNITLPTALSNDHQDDINNLRQKTGKDFDKAYIDFMIKDHEHDINEFESAVNNVKDADLNAFAVETLPTLRKHLERCKSIRESMK